MTETPGDSSATPSGWYLDPEDSTQFRFWDGTAWTEHRSPANAGKESLVQAAGGKLTTRMMTKFQASREAHKVRRAGEMEAQRGVAAARAATVAAIRVEVDEALARAVECARERNLIREMEWCEFAVAKANEVSPHESALAQQRIQGMLTSRELQVGWRLIGVIPAGMIRGQIARINSNEVRIARRHSSVIVHSNRIVFQGQNFVVDEFTSAEVTLDGQVLVSHRATGVSSVGVGLGIGILGVGFGSSSIESKKERHDLRVAQFMVASPGWSISVGISPEQVHVPRQIAFELNRVTALMADGCTKGVRVVGIEGTQGESESILTQLERLQGLVISGAITFEEASRVKERLLGQK